MKKILITDLDDTLYSWIGFFIPAFYGMVEELSNILHVPMDELISEYKEIHQKQGSVESPFSTLKLPSVKQTFPELNEEEIRGEIGEAFHRFNSYRKYNLKLYDGVKSTLKLLHKKGIKIIGYTESASENGYYRLKKLGVAQYFDAVFVSKSSFNNSSFEEDSHSIVIAEGKKPNVDILKTICKKENISISDAVYVGDSLTKDMYMAIKAKITSVWINYKENNEELYNKLVKISHWTDADFKREELLKSEWKNKKMRPDYVINNFKELVPIVTEELNEK